MQITKHSVQMNILLGRESTISREFVYLLRINSALETFHTIDVTIFLYLSTVTNFGDVTRKY